MSYDLWGHPKGYGGNQIAAELDGESAKELVTDLVVQGWEYLELSLCEDAWEQAISGDELRKWVEGDQ